MEPDESVLTDSLALTDSTLATMVKRLQTGIETMINVAGHVADCCTTGTGAGVHGCQMSYDRLVEAEAWAARALKELEA